MALSIGPGLELESNVYDILHVHQPQLPEFRFEWHPKTAKVFSIRVGVIPEVPQIISEVAVNQGIATNLILCFMRGYMNRKHEKDFCRMSEHIRID